MNFNAEAARNLVDDSKNAPLARIMSRFVEPAAKKGKTEVTLKYWVNKRKREFLVGAGFGVEKTTRDLARGKVQKVTIISWAAAPAAADAEG